MPLSPFVGHTVLRDRLRSALEGSRLPQSLLLHGPAGVGKQRLAMWVSQMLVCERPHAPCGECRHCRFSKNGQHPDIVWVFPRPRFKDADPSPEQVQSDIATGIDQRLRNEGLYPPPSGSEGIFVATIRQVVRQAVLRPAIAARRAIVVGDADRMVPQEGSEQSANAFLKLLEEPPSSTWIILTTSRPGTLLPTIRSRVAAVRVPRLPDTVVAEWLGLERVRAGLAALKITGDDTEFVRRAAGAPGSVLSGVRDRKAAAEAREILGALDGGDDSEHARVALSQGVSGARGTFTDILDVLTDQFRDRMADAARCGDDARARQAARAILLVDEARRAAHGNNSPPLITAALLESLSR